MDVKLAVALGFMAGLLLAALFMLVLLLIDWLLSLLGP